MKLAFVVHNQYQGEDVMQILRETGIDYYTRWDEVTGKGHGTEPHLGAGGFPGKNSVLMIAFTESEPLEALIRAITEANRRIQRTDDKIRLFQLPLERMV